MSRGLKWGSGGISFAATGSNKTRGTALARGELRGAALFFLFNRGTPRLPFIRARNWGQLTLGTRRLLESAVSGLVANAAAFRFIDIFTTSPQYATRAQPKAQTLKRTSLDRYGDTMFLRSQLQWALCGLGMASRPDGWSST